MNLSKSLNSVGSPVSSARWRDSATLGEVRQSPLRRANLGRGNREQDGGTLGIEASRAKQSQGWASALSQDPQGLPSLLNPLSVRVSVCHGPSPSFQTQGQDQPCGHEAKRSGSVSPSVFLFFGHICVPMKFRQLWNLPSALDCPQLPSGSSLSGRTPSEPAGRGRARERGPGWQADTDLELEALRLGCVTAEERKAPGHRDCSSEGCPLSS